MTEQSITEYFTTPTYSPYGMMKVVNKILSDLGIDKVLPGPMFYTYTKKGYIKSYVVGGKVTISAESATEWTEKYLTKLVKKVQVVEEVEEEVEMTEPLPLEV
jgi:osmotically-inducible protein OsmY